MHRSRRVRSRIAALAGLGLAGLGLAGSVAVAGATPTATAATDRASSTGPVYGGTLTFGTDTEPVCWNPQRSGQQNSYPLIRNFAESLVGQESATKFVPWLAQSWTVSPNGLDYTFHLRPNVYFSDGERLTAAAVKQNFDFIANPKNAESGALQLAYYQESVVVNPTTVEVVLKQPDSTLLESISSIALAILAPKTLDGETGSNQACDANDTLIGTGPFTIGTYVRGQQITFDRNPRYDWAPGYAAHNGKAYLDKIVYRFLPVTSVREGALEAGQVDAIEGVQPTDVASIKSNPNLWFSVGPTTGFAFSLNLNYRKGILADPDVRLALRDGFNLTQIVNSLYEGTVPRAWSSIAQDSPYFDTKLENTWGDNVKQANKLLDEDGWTGRDSQGYRTKDGQPLVVDVQYPTAYIRDNRDVLIQAIAAQLKQNVGMDLDLQEITSGTFEQELENGTWDIYPDTLPIEQPALMFDELQGSGGFLFAPEGGSDGKINAWIAAARATSSYSKEKTLLDDIQTRLIQNAFVVPLYDPTYNIAANKKVHGLGYEYQQNSWANGYDVWIS